MKNNHNHHYKIFIFVFVLVHFALSQSSLPTRIKLYQFKNNRNPDFGIGLPKSVTTGIINNQLINGLPEYCCESESTYHTQDPSLIVVHNETTFNQWWKSSIDDNDYCRNYELYIPVQVETYPYRTIFTVQQTEGIGFNNITEFPEYNEDPETNLYCYNINLHLIPISESTDHAIVMYNSEFWIFIDGELVLDQGARGYIDLASQYQIPNRDLNLQIFKCNRDNYASQDSIEIIGYYVSCPVDDICGTCGFEICPEKCIDDITSCAQSKVVCGSCFHSSRSCDDNDVCTLDICTQGYGCDNQEIKGCYCTSENCYSNDLCFKYYCEDRYNCVSDPVICVGNSTCLEPECEFGECKCSDHDPVTLSSTSTTSSTISTTGTIVTTSSIDSTNSISSSISSSSTSLPIIKAYECNQLSCPSGYCCIQLHRSYTCVSRYFELNCNNDNLLSQFY